MSDKEYHVVNVNLDDAEELKPDVHLEVAGVKLDLPNLNNAELPIELVQAILLVKSKPALSDEENMACVSTFLAYFQTMQPNFWNVLRKTKRPMAYLTATIKRGPTNPDWTKSVYLAQLWNTHRAALAYDWIRAYGQIYRPVRFAEWLEANVHEPTGSRLGVDPRNPQGPYEHSWMALQNAV